MSSCDYAIVHLSYLRVATLCHFMLLVDYGTLQLITGKTFLTMIMQKTASAMMKWSNACSAFVFSKEKKYLHIFVRPVEAYSNCSFDFTKFVSFGKFTTVLNQVFKLNTTKAAIHTTIAYSLIFYYFVPVCVTSAAANYLSRVGTVFTLPIFLSTLIMKVGLEVRTSTAEEGGIRGTTICSHNVHDVTHLLLTLDRQTFLSLIKDSPFSSVVSESDYKLVLMKIRSTLPEFTGSYDAENKDDDSKEQPRFNIVLSDSESLYFQMFGFFAVLPSIFHSTNFRLEVFDFKLERGVSRLVNIHRFRNTTFADQFIVNSHSIASIAETTKSEFACFLKLFSPMFYQDADLKINNTYLLANEVFFDLSAVTEEQALTYLFELTKISSSPNRKSTVKTQRGIANEPSITDLPVEEIVRKGNKHRSKYFKTDNIQQISNLVTSIVLDILSQSSLTSIDKLDLGSESIYYYSPRTMKVPVVAPNDFNLLNSV